MASSLQPLVLGTSMSFSFILAGNAITQCWMTVLALLVDFPKPTYHDYATKSALLGRQWSICYNAENDFFRPISALSALGYAFASYRAFNSSNNFDRRAFAVAALAHVAVIMHSAVLMDPVNLKILALGK